MNGNATAPRVLDDKTIEHIRTVSEDIDPAFLDELIGIYLAQTPKLMEALATAARQGDLETLEASAHRLKGSSLNLGVVRMAALCGEIEKQAAAGSAADAEAMARSLAETFAAAEAALRALKGSGAR